MKPAIRRLTAALCALALCLTSAFAVSVQDVLDLLERYYVDELPAAAYEATTLDELFAAVGDPYTYYMDEEAYRRFNASIESETSVTGIGVTVRFTEAGIEILNVLNGGGAKDAGLRAGDVIIAIDGESCVPGGDQYISRIGGEVGTSVDITVRRTDGSVRTFAIMRRLIELHNTTVTLEDGVGYIDCQSFGSRTGEYFSSGIQQYNDQSRVWIVDLRGNTGGYASAAVQAAGVFSGLGAKLHFVDRQGYSEPSSYYGRDLTDKPAIVLVNAGTASASEIFSGDVRAENSGIIVGSRTYGKGLAQLVFDGSTNPGIFGSDAVKISVYRFYCSDGNTTDKLGVLPTLYVDDAYTAGVGRLLCAEKPAAGEYLTLALNGNTFIVDPAAAHAEGLDDALGELLSALPPDVTVLRTAADGSTETLTSDRALALYAPASVSRRFNDVSLSAYAEAINILGTYGIVLGDGKGGFSPNRTLTRAELCAMLAQALNISSTASGLFSDVPDGRWFTGDVNAIAALGFVNGLGDGTFDPYGTLTQEQFITIMGRLVCFLNFHADQYANGLSTEAMLANRSLTVLSPWAQNGASVLTSYAGNMLYTDLGSIAPKTAVTREQAAATLCNILKTLDILSY